MQQQARTVLNQRATNGRGHVVSSCPDAIRGLGQKSAIHERIRPHPQAGGRGLWPSTFNSLALLLEMTSHTVGWPIPPRTWIKFVRRYFTVTLTGFVLTHPTLQIVPSGRRAVASEVST